MTVMAEAGGRTAEEDGPQRLLHITGPLEFTSAADAPRHFGPSPAVGRRSCMGSGRRLGHEAIAASGMRAVRGPMASSAATTRSPAAWSMRCASARQGAGGCLRHRLRQLGDHGGSDAPPLTTVDMNLKELGREAGLMVLALAEGRTIEPGLRSCPAGLSYGTPAEAGENRSD